VQVLPLIREAEWHGARSNLRRPDEYGLS
jgi:hypothetical protein